MSPKRHGLDAKLRKARVLSSLFGKPSAEIKIQRFTVLERIGSGHMGEVYAAYDDRLDRKCAIKLVRGTFHDASQAYERMMREAQTLARLSHPNVVQVYDAGNFEGQVYIAMEFIRGRTITRWLDSVSALPPRERIPRIMRQFIAAGRGLEAAHNADLVHRDFKPDNVMVGDDGRVRVVDFGLARPRIMSADSPMSSGRDMGAGGDVSAPNTDLADTVTIPRGTSATGLDLSPRLTATGALVGTPAYMAPEVLRGGAADQRSDQFSYCVALYEALYQEPPFPRNNITALKAAIASVDLSAHRPDKNVPISVHRVLVRGLSADPEARFADMAALLAALAEWPRRRRWLWLAAVGVAAFALVGALGYGRGQTEPLCASADDEVEQLWNPRRVLAVERAVLKTGQRYAETAWRDDIRPKLDVYADDMKSMYSDMCLDREQGRDSDRKSDRRSACMAERQARFDGIVRSIVDKGAPSADKLVQTVADLPSVADCDNNVLLETQEPLPSDPVTRAEVQRLREELEIARAAVDRGRYLRASAIARDVAEDAEVVDYGPLQVEALMLQGWSENAREGGEQALATGTLRRAFGIALQNYMQPKAIEAFARLVYAGRSTNIVARCLPDEVATIESLGQGLYQSADSALPRVAFAYALLLNNIGTAYKACGLLSQARTYFDKAVAVIDARGSGNDDGNASSLNNVELIAARQNLAFFIEDHGQRRQQMERVVDSYEDRLGNWHPLSLQARTIAAHFIADDARARDILASACKGYAEYHPGLTTTLLRCFYELALIDVKLGAVDRAIESWEEVVGRVAEVAEPPAITQLARAWGHLHRDRPHDALPILLAVRKSMPQAPTERWRWLPIADAHAAIAATQRALGQPEAAAVHLAQARAALERLIGGNPNHMGYRRRLAQIDND